MISFITYYDIKRLFVLSYKTIHQKATAFYCFACPYRHEKYISKTNRNRVTRLNEKGTCKEQTMH